MALFARNKDFQSLQARCRSFGNQYIAFLRLSDNGETLFICVTDGINVWRLEFSEDEIDNYMKFTELSSKDDFIANVVSSFKAAELEVSLLPQKLTLAMGKEPNVVNFNLYETSVQQKKEDLQHLLFAFSDKVEKLEGKLKDANEKLENMSKEQKAETSAFSPFKEHEPKKSKITRPKQGKGHSVINPGSKRKHTAKGVVFD